MRGIGLTIVRPEIGKFGRDQGARKISTCAISKYS
jgi:hypothetical protein